ncbi:Outer membrane usher protein fimD precursor [Cedecea lapagei]|uniref:Outer membrane usher protein fimD n=1 Tax=Cedecea lapagei TaxID=158823 RepID=A0A3S4IH76_9ENTR|nr:fimbria/pilus outer membrane usher protein [Cedecea lapagei]VEB96603.1 Outer membrane usher protein fimD precursor [Cedecea lapagei]
MVKKQNKIYDWPYSLVKIILLNGLFFSGTTAAQNTNNDLPQNAVTNGTTQPVGVDLYLDTTVNGNSVGLVHLGYAEGKLYADAMALRQLGIRLPEKAQPPFYLNDLPQVSVDYNVQQQTLALTAPLSLLDLKTTQLNQSDISAPTAANAFGALLNYDLYADGGKESNFNSFSEFRVFSSAGVLSSTQLTRYSTEQNNGSSFSRLDTSWRTSFPEQMVAVSLGDTLTSSLAWSRQTRIAGIKVGTDFGLKPYMPTTPLPAFLGSATLPSSVELYVNGVKYYNGEVPAGSFQLNTLPNITGAGNAQVMMTDALGRTSVQNFSFYNDQLLLREGLTDWSLELGVVRKNYGYSSFDYGSEPALSGTWRRGFSNSLTAGGHFEASNSLVNGGISSDWIPGSQAGTISTALAASADAGENGYLYGLGYRWSGGRFNFSSSATATSGDYHDVATRYGAPPPTFSGSAVLGYNFGQGGNLSLSYLQFRYPDQSAVRYANASWFKSITESISLSASFNQNVDNTRDRSVYLMMTVSTQNNLTASATVQRTGDKMGYQLNASQAPPSEGGVGWNVAGSQQSSQQSGQGEVGYLGRYGRVYTGFRSIPDNHYGYAGATGSLVMMGGGVFAAREINNGFAVVSTDGIPDVPVKLQNNLVGNSDSSGLLLVTPLNSYQNNLISIDPMNLPANMRIRNVSLNATPADRSGTLVNFEIKPVRAAQVLLVDVRGKAIVEGSPVRSLAGSGQETVVGFDGMAYFDALELHNQLRVTTENGSCLAEFDYPENQKSIPNIGPIVCR